MILTNAFDGEMGGPGKLNAGLKQLARFRNSGFEKGFIKGNAYMPAVSAAGDADKNSMFQAVKDRAAEGDLTAFGKNAAMHAIGGTLKDHYDELGGIGKGAVAEGRQGLFGIVDDAQRSVSKGNPFDLGALKDKLGAYSAKFNSGLGGKLSDVLAGQSFGDPAKVMQIAARAQGAQNTRTDTLAAALAKRRGNNSTNDLGDGGVF